MSLLQRLQTVSGKFSPQLARLADLGARLQVSGKPCLLLCWDLCGLHAALAEGGGVPNPARRPGCSARRFPAPATCAPRSPPYSNNWRRRD